MNNSEDPFSENEFENDSFNDEEMDRWLGLAIANEAGHQIRITTTYGEIYEGVIKNIRDEGVFLENSTGTRKFFTRIGAIVSYSIIIKKSRKRRKPKALPTKEA